MRRKSCKYILQTVFQDNMFVTILYGQNYFMGMHQDTV